MTYLYSQSHICHHNTVMDSMYATEVYDGTKVQWQNRRIHSRATVFGEIRYLPGGICGPRHQRDVELVIIHSGSCHVKVDTVKRSLPIGWAALFLPGHQENFCFAGDVQTHHTWCTVRPDSLSAVFRKRLVNIPAMAPCSPAFNHLHAAAFRLQPPLDLHRRAALDHLAQSLLHEYVAMADEWACRRSSELPLDRALRYMEDHLGDADCLAGAHTVSGLSRNALIYKFRNSLGTTPAHHLWHLRTERGVAMLGDTGLTVSEIAERCGFANPFHFSRLVSRSQGVSPTEVRRQAWSQRIRPITAKRQLKIPIHPVGTSSRA